MISPSTPLPAELLALVGTGSDGAVHRARQHGLDREVALKLPGAGAEPGDLRREALAAAAVEHPGAVVVHGVGAGWLMSQLVEGGTVRDLLAEHPGPLAGERLGPVVEALAAVADTLAAAHALGVVHGEVLAEHILLGRYGEVVLVDWGRALRLDHGPAGLPDAATADPGRIAPTARAPELLAGDRAAVGAATDVWQLGQVLAAAIRLQEGRDPGPGRPPALVALAESALGPVPGRPSAATLAAALRAWIQGSAGSALALALRGDAERIAAAVPAESAAAVAAWQRVEHLARSARLQDPGLAVDDLLAAARRGRLRLALAAGDLAHARTAARALGPDLDPDDGAALAALATATARRDAWRRLAIRAATAGGVAALLVLLAWPLLRWQESAARESARLAEAVRLAAAARAEPDPERGLETALVAAGLDPAGPGAAVAARLAASAAALAVEAGRPGAAAEAFALAVRFDLAGRDPALAARLGAGPDAAGSVAWAAAAATRAALRTAAERAAAVAGWLDGDPDLDEAAITAAAARWGAWDPLDGADADRLRGWWRRALTGGTAQGRLACRVAAAAFRRGVRIYPAADLMPVIARPDLRTAAAEAVALAGDDALYEPVFTALAADQSWSDRSPVLAGWMRRLEAPVMAAARAATTADAVLRRRIEKTLWRHRALQVQTDNRDLPVLLATDPGEAEELSAFNALSRASFHNDWPTALAAAERLIAVRPERESYWADAIQAADRTGDSAGAWARAQAALARFPDPGARLLVQAAAAARDAGASASAAPLIQAARAAMAASAISDTRTLETFRGLIAGLPGGADEAVAVARAHRANQPDDGWKTVDLADALIEAERYAEAVAVADEGLARWPDFHFIHANRALALARLGRIDEALAAAETAVSIYPRNPGILRYQSRVLDLAGRREHALGRLLMGLALHNRWPVQDEVLTLARRTGPHADGDAVTAARAVLADPETYGGLPRMFAGLQAVRIACERDQAWAALPVIDAMAGIAQRPAAATAALAVLAAGIPAWQDPGRAPVPDLDVAWTLVQDAGAILAASRSVTATAAARIAARCAAALRLAGDNAVIAGRARAYQAVAGGDATAALAALLTVGEGVEPEIAQVRRHLLDPAEPLLPLDYDRWDGWTVRRPIPDLGFDAAAIRALGELLVRRGATAALPAPTPGWRRIPDNQLTRHLGGVDRGWDFPPASWKARQAALAAAKAASTATAAASASTAQGR